MIGEAVDLGRGERAPERAPAERRDERAEARRVVRARGHAGHDRGAERRIGDHVGGDLSREQIGAVDQRLRGDLLPVVVVERRAVVGREREHGRHIHADEIEDRRLVLERREAACPADADLVLHLGRDRGERRGLVAADVAVARGDERRGRQRDS